MSGIKCVPATHAYEPLGKIAFCTKCADVQPLLLDESEPIIAPQATLSPGFEHVEPPPEADPAELEAAIHRLREAAGIGTEDELGQRLPFEGDLGDEPRVARVDEGHTGSPFNDTLPDPGL